MVPAEKPSSLQFLNLFRGYARMQSECNHPKSVFNGYVWRCADCGIKMKEEGEQ
jgi:hypothetical protein